jgi:hypothetical protein
MALRSSIAIFVYVVCHFGLMDLRDKILHFQHVGLRTSTLTSVLITGFLFPLLLGFICGSFLKPRSLVNYWPIIVAPFVTLALRIIVDDVFSNWILQNLLSLILATTGTVLVSLLGSWVYAKFVTD